MLNAGHVTWMYRLKRKIDCKAVEVRAYPHPHISPTTASPDNAKFIDYAESALLKAGPIVFDLYGAELAKRAEPELEYDRGIGSWRLVLKFSLAQHTHKHSGEEEECCGDDMVVIDNALKYTTSFKWRVPKFQHQVLTNGKEKDLESKHKVVIDPLDWVAIDGNDFLEDDDRVSTTAECGDEDLESDQVESFDGEFDLFEDLAKPKQLAKIKTPAET
ncbi:hypothetical protein NA57DRAFT_54084 [Rhizodiscina lignyota]|uniref:Uncharacterized protein n=1 Tax=Rhizodiscina lignyota TaxID=1504668 RepID=A0A9P4M9I9_9PEZI|nr:hypothetical protein NA57DRAFT_54084 [Rhizodiscina lignyota]